MAIKVKDFTYGKKVFFIAPDTTIFPESFLQEYFAHGYEVYFIENDARVNFRDKIRLLISIFNDAIFYFNVDANIPDINWVQYITELKSRCSSSISFGVFYAKKINKNINQMYEQKFLYEVGVSAGCIQLEYQKNLNLMLVEKFLFLNQAKGRRQNIRGLCDKNYSYSFIKDDITYNGNLQDISLSHFSFLIPEDSKLYLEIGEKLTEFRFFLNGLLFRNPVVLMASRKTPNGILYVFAFLGENGPGLNPRYKQLLIPNIYNLMTIKLNDIIQIVSQMDADGELDPRTIDEIEID